MKLYRRTGSAAWWAYHRAGGKTYRKSIGTGDKRKAEAKARRWAQQLDERAAVEQPELMLSAAIGSFLDHCKRNGLAKQTVRGYDGRLRVFLNRVGDQDVSAWTEDDAVDLVTHYLETRSHEIASIKHDRLPLSTLFNYLKALRVYRGANPASAVLHRLRQPRQRLRKKNRCTTRQEDEILRREGHKSILWPMLLLTRWAGLRRGEAAALRWSEVDLDKGCADVVGHEGGRKHPRTVWLAQWVVMQLRAMRPAWLPHDGDVPIWTYHVDQATKLLDEFCEQHLGRKLGFNDLRASFATDCYKRGMTATQESRIVGHSAAVAEKHYLEYEAAEARSLLPPDPLVNVDYDEPRKTEVPARAAQ